MFSKIAFHFITFVQIKTRKIEGKRKEEKTLLQAFLGNKSENALIYESEH